LIRCDEAVAGEIDAEAQVSCVVRLPQTDAKTGHASGGDARVCVKEDAWKPAARANNGRWKLGMNHERNEPKAQGCQG
jgi:hypothetical protein